MGRVSVIVIPSVMKNMENRLAVFSYLNEFWADEGLLDTSTF